MKNNFFEKWSILGHTDTLILPLISGGCNNHGIKQISKLWSFWIETQKVTKATVQLSKMNPKYHIQVDYVSTFCHRDKDFYKNSPCHMKQIVATTCPSLHCVAATQFGSRHTEGFVAET